VWWKARESPAELVEIVVSLREYGTYLMSIDARLEEIVALLGGEDDAGSDADG
jgi:hypothetical protein